MPKDMKFRKIITGMFDYDSYFSDIPVLKLVAYYMKLISYDKVIFEGEIEIEQKSYHIKVNHKTNDVFINGEIHSPIYFVHFINGSNCDHFSIIKEVTGINHTNYYYELNIPMSEKNPND